jgi:hypothetical protein
MTEQPPLPATWRIERGEGNSVMLEMAALTAFHRRR